MSLKPTNEPSTKFCLASRYNMKIFVRSFYSGSNLMACTKERKKERKKESRRI